MRQKKRKKKNNKIVYNKKKNILLIIALFFTGVILIASSYAWFYASLNVKVDFIKMKVSDESGLLISLDGINYSDSVSVSREIIIDDVKKTYATNTNQWAIDGLFPVSTIGINNSSDSKFNIFVSTVRQNKKTKVNYIDTFKLTENEASFTNYFIAFDVFLKNVTGSPYSDNLYLTNETNMTIYNNDLTRTDGTTDSIRIGLLKINSTSRRSSIDIIQGLDCNNSCEAVIYEPNSTNHEPEAIERVEKYKVNLVQGETYPTYAVIAEGKEMLPINGNNESGIEYDPYHFKLQETITTFDNPIFQIPNGVTKVRVYVWLEGQDIDNLETKSMGAKIALTINLYKDLAGYEM